MTCPQCGHPARWREVHDVETGHVVASGPLCNPCFDAAVVEAAEFRRQFDDLIALGVNRALANEVLIARVDARSAARRAAKGTTP